MAASMYDWSLVAANNGTADAAINWAEGMAPSAVNDSARVMMQRGKQLLVDLGGSIAAGGTANAVTLTASSPFSAYADGQVVSFKATANNSGAATLNVNGIGAKSIRKMDASGDVPLAGAEIISGGIFIARYLAALNAAAGGWLLENPVPGNTILISTAAGAGAGPTYTLYRNAPGAFGNVLGRVNYDGKDSGATQQTYAATETRINAATAGAEQGMYVITVASNGTTVDGLAVQGDAVGGSQTIVGGLLQVIQGQILFAGGGTISGDPTTLDAYSEQTFNPVITGTTIAGSGTYTLQDGKYTRIGNRVYFELDVTWTGHTGTGNMTVTGLPFTSSSTSVVCTVYSENLTFAGTPVGLIAFGGSSIILRSPVSGSTATPVAMDAAARLVISGCYKVT